MADRARADALLERANAALARLALDEALALLTEAIPILRTEKQNRLPRQGAVQSSVLPRAARPH